MNSARVIVMLCLIILAGCGLYESAGGIPKATAVLQAPDGAAVEQVFDCAETSINDLSEPGGFWRSDVTRRDVVEGILETGDYRKTNVGGLRVRITFGGRSNEITMDLKGAGAYYKDIGVEKSMADLKKQMQNCLKPLNR